MVKELLINLIISRENKNKDIKIETENVRAGSPLNYVRDKKNIKDSKQDRKSLKNSVIVMQPTQPEKEDYK